ncbi:MAG: ectoine/hydroxyectoine ABC transporter substrate-binding protein EhuB [Kiritimatiellae bacterium]|nr:ectoine/hydroxyectoine ABC transporter substrate-binding protein EhuB [Kiritimatiellia bacterium]
MSICFTVFLAACGGGGPQQSTLERIRETGVVRIGYANEAPYAYRDTATGELTGEAPEIAKVILEELGVTEVEGVLTEFGSLIPGLQAGRFDIIAAGMYILPERCAQIAFSNPTYAIGEAFAVLEGNPKGLHSYEDIRDHEDATLGVVAGAVERRYARQVGIPDDRVVVFPDAPAALSGVRAGRVDAYGGTALTVQDLISKDDSGRLERADPFTDPVIDGERVKGYGAFGFRRQDRDLVEAFNVRLATFIGSDEHRELVEPFGFTEQELPGDVTAEELCAVTAAD